jgi:POT family proton-dependent oligopeptide transporter
MSNEPAKAAMPLFEVDEKRALSDDHTPSTLSHEPQNPNVFDADLEGEEPTEEDLKTLRRVSGKIPWTAFTIAFVELCERFGYYGCQVLCMLPSIAKLYPNLLTFPRYQLHPEGSPYN